MLLMKGSQCSHINKIHTKFTQKLGIQKRWVILSVTSPPPLDEHGSSVGRGTIDNITQILVDSRLLIFIVRTMSLRPRGPFCYS